MKTIPAALALALATIVSTSCDSAQRPAPSGSGSRSASALLLVLEDLPRGFYQSDDREIAASDAPGFRYAWVRSFVRTSSASALVVNQADVFESPRAASAALAIEVERYEKETVRADPTIRLWRRVSAGTKIGDETFAFEGALRQLPSFVVMFRVREARHVVAVHGDFSSLRAAPDEVALELAAKLLRR